MKDTKMLTRVQLKDAEIAEKTGNEHKTNHNTPTWTTNVLTVEVTT